MPTIFLSRVAYSKPFSSDHRASCGPSVEEDQLNATRPSSEATARNVYEPKGNS